jgi:hypothetical protein
MTSSGAKSLTRSGVLVRSGRTNQEVLAEMAAVVGNWIASGKLAKRAAASRTEKAVVVEAVSR